MNNFIVLTSKKRKLELPLLLTDMQSNEEIVSTDAPHGMLFALSDPRRLKSYFQVDESELEKGELICVPVIDDFKEQEKQRLINQIKNLDNV